jgi:hypothetical protein
LLNEVTILEGVRDSTDEPARFGEIGRLQNS